MIYLELLQIYVIGSNTKLGQWKVENGLKLSYFGESVWQAECLMQRSDFPIKYPFWSFHTRPYDEIMVLLISRVASIKKISSHIATNTIISHHGLHFTLTVIPHIDIANMAGLGTFL